MFPYVVSTLKRRGLVVLTVAGLALLGQNAVAAPAAAAGQPTVEQMQSVLQRQSSLLDAHLAAMKAGLQLTDAQAQKWPPFEAAIREAAAARSARWLSAGERMRGAAAPSALERISIMADHLEKNAQELRRVVEAGQPLFDSLTDPQKVAFGPLMREFRPKKRL